eukprot:TRINITY_DN10727_c0_g1_i2.p1 TRINITY_DN10727_c0_g1~~TRINITY_DN10727_c0_g1_i2.p1  ORF type:complete len:284 (-),score=77.75 TRINITY_DN10727_c0_g1_i2:29-880(-)
MPLSCLFLALLLASSCSSLPKRQRYTSFKNFPVVGIKENHEEVTPVEVVEEMVDTENVARAARQVEPSSYTDALDDVFVEEAVYLTPEDRDQRAIEIDNSELSNVEFDNFEYNDESLVEEENERPERDGAHGSHGSVRHSARNSRRFQQSQQVLRSKTSDRLQLRSREEGDRLDRLDLLLGFSAILLVLRGITTSTSPMMMAPRGRNQELLMEYLAATASSPLRVSKSVSSMWLMRQASMLQALMSHKLLPCLLMSRDYWTISLRLMASLDYRSQPCYASQSI